MTCVMVITGLNVNYNTYNDKTQVSQVNEKSGHLLIKSVIYKKWKYDKITPVLMTFGLPFEVFVTLSVSEQQRCYLISQTHK